jgi:hypothetical protein
MQIWIRNTGAKYTKRALNVAAAQINIRIKVKFHSCVERISFILEYETYSTLCGRKFCSKTFLFLQKFLRKEHIFEKIGVFCFGKILRKNIRDFRKKAFLILCENFREKYMKCLRKFCAKTKNFREAK